jgi:4-amino-4-deoxy-L-arabinose transferase-like glycosyltransferase
MNNKWNEFNDLINQKKVIEYGILALITLLAAFLRFYMLGEWSFWGDEVFSIGNKSDGFVESTTVSIIHLTTAILGTSEWSARFFPALVGTISIPLVYFPVKRILGIWVGLIFSILLAVSSWHIYWSQNARFYVLMLLFYTLALLIFYIGLKEDRPWFFIISLLLLGLAIKERLLALFFIPVILCFLLTIYYLRFEKPPGLRWRNLAIFFIPSILLSLIYAIPFLKDIPGWFTGFGRINNNPFWLVAGSFYYISLPVIFLSTFGSVYFLWRKSRPVLLFSLGAAIPLIGIVSMSLFQYTANRYVFISLTSWLILAAMTINEIFILLKGNAKFLAIGIVLLVLGTSMSENVLYFRFQEGNRDNWKAAYEYISQHKRADDLIITENIDVGRYYLKDRVKGFHNFEQEEIGDNQRIWFVEDLTVEELYPKQRAWMLNNAQLIADFDNYVRARVFTMRVYLYSPVE